MQSFKHGIAALSAAALVAFSGGVGAAPEITLKLGTTSSDTTSLGKGIAQVLVPKVKEYSEGRMEVAVHWSNSLCSEQICGEQARQGLVDIATSSTANFGNFGPSYAVTDLPYIFKDLDSANALARGWFGEAIAERALEETGFRVYGLFSVGGFRGLGNNVRPIKEPKDLKGIKIRVTKSPVEFTLIKTWGGVPIPYDWLQLYQGLQTGVVNGEYVQTPWQYVFKHHEVNKFYTETGGAWGGNHLSADLKQYNALSEQDKKWLKVGVDRFSKVARAKDKAWVAEMTEKLKKEIDVWYKPNAAEMEMWRAGAVGAWKDAKGTYDGKLAERALAEQGLDDFIASLKKGGAL
jgi:TRAP-type C4-dicarboxylate transport system substrate-binding protein